MKSDFHVNKNLMQLNEVLSEHEPYAVLVVSTTGMDNKDCDKHSPTRVQLVQFEFDSELKQYTESISFNKLVAADIEAVNAAIANKEAGAYDAFGNAEIDADSYKAQVEDLSLAAKTPEDQRVLSQEKFKKVFEYAMTAIQHDGTTLLVNGFEHSRKYLAKIGCADQLTEIARAGNTIDQPALNAEYLSSHGITDKKSVPLEMIRNAFMPEPNIPTILDENGKEVPAEPDPREAKATASERVQIINQLVTAYGREQGILENEHLAYLRERTEKQRQAASERAKRRYDNSPIQRKVATQVEMNLIDRDAVLDGDSQYQKLMDALSGESGKKGVAFVHIATSGMQNPRGSETGLPMQLFVRVVPVDEEGKGLDASKSSGFNFYMNVPKSVVLQAEKQAKAGKFDVFKDAGIDPEQYKSGVITMPNGKQSKVYSEAEFTKIVSTLFSPEKVDPEKYAIIALGGKGEQAFFQKALASICTDSIVNAPTIDAVQAIAEYALLTVEGRIEENVLFDSKTDVKGFGIRDVAEALGKELNGTGDKVNALFMAVSAMYNQYLELTKEDRQQEEEAEKKPVKAEEKADDFLEVDEIEVPMAEGFAEETSEGVPDEGVPEAEESEFEEFDFADEDGFDGETYSEEPQEEQPTELDAREQFEFDGIEEFFTAAEGGSKKNKEEENREAESDNKVIPLRPTRKKDDAPAERPSRRMPEPKPTLEQVSSDVQALYAIIAKQSEQIAQQSATIQRLSEITAQQAEQANTRMFGVLQQQNELMKTVVMQSFQQAQHRPTPSRMKAEQKKFEGDVMERLEQIKDAISDICGEVPQKVSEYLHEANASISDGQQELESPKKTAEPKPVA